MHTIATTNENLLLRRVRDVSVDGQHGLVLILFVLFEELLELRQDVLGVDLALKEHDDKEYSLCALNHVA